MDPLLTDRTHYFFRLFCWAIKILSPEESHEHEKDRSPTISFQSYFLAINEVKPIKFLFLEIHGFAADFLSLFYNHFRFILIPR